MPAELPPCRDLTGDFVLFGAVSGGLEVISAEVFKFG